MSAFQLPDFFVHHSMIEQHCLTFYFTFIYDNVDLFKLIDLDYTDKLSCQNLYKKKKHIK